MLSRKVATTVAIWGVRWLDHVQSNESPNVLNTPAPSATGVFRADAVKGYLSGLQQKMEALTIVHGLVDHRRRDVESRMHCLSSKRIAWEGFQVPLGAPPNPLQQQDIMHVAGASLVSYLPK
jgi:hypothetical protein